MLAFGRSELASSLVPRHGVPRNAWVTTMPDGLSAPGTGICCDDAAPS